MADRMVVVKDNRVICQEAGNADGSQPLFLAASRKDDRLSKDNLKFYRVVEVQGGGASWKYPKLELSVGDLVLTEAIGIEFKFQGQTYRMFDVDHIVGVLEGDA